VEPVAPDELPLLPEEEEPDVPELPMELEPVPPLEPEPEGLVLDELEPVPPPPAAPLPPLSHAPSARTAIRDSTAAADFVKVVFIGNSLKFVRFASH